MATNGFTTLATSRLPTPSRLFANSCCPDKDLIVLFSRLGGSDRMSLWNSSQGTRIWETDVRDGDVSSTAIGIAWSPDGQSIAVARDPPGVSFHSVQDGHRFQMLPINDGDRVIHLSGIWWFRDEKPNSKPSNNPDIFKRANLITGSAHSVLKILPLLDHLQEESDELTATDLFAFQGSHTRSSKSKHTPVIEAWPSLPADRIAASISPSAHSKTTHETANLDELDNSNTNSILLVADNQGYLFSFLDGVFPLGIIPLGQPVDFPSFVKHPLRPCLVGQPRFGHGKHSTIALNPTLINLPLLGHRATRDFAKLSSTGRELAWYATRAVKEMHGVWYGNETNSGARELGPKWAHALEAKQRELFGQQNPNPVLDLTILLTTGRASESLSDFLGSGELTGERGIQKWESSVSEAFVKLRDVSEKCLAPALQRLYLIINEVQGWAKLPHFVVFQLSAEELTAAHELASRGIMLANWLAAESRKQLGCFKEFIAWLRYEVSNVNSPNDGNVPRHDILEVNNYLTSGLVSSPIDSWFIGPTPQFRLRDLGIPEPGKNGLDGAMEHARSVANDPALLMAWQMHDVNHVDKNLDALIEDLALRCQRVFHQASGAVSRSAIVSYSPPSDAKRTPEKVRSPEPSLAFPFRERSVLNERGEVVQHLLVHMPSEANNTMLLTQLRFSVEESGLPSQIGVALLECYLPDEDQEDSNLDLLDADFFDDECVVIVYRLRRGEKQTSLAIVNYTDAGYQNLADGGYVTRCSQEDLMHDSLELWKSGHLSSTKIPIMRHRTLSSCKDGGASLALNGRTGRRVACVLDITGTVLESFDLEGDVEDMEVADDGRATHRAADPLLVSPDEKVPDAILTLLSHPPSPPPPMPKSPKSPSTLPKQPTDLSARMSDVALRKKKNADAQAAFRARRANYIATLEETVTSLESVVLQLQESCRESRSEALDLRQENSRLRHEYREREKFWRALYYAKKTGQPSEPDDLPPPPLSSPYSAHSQVAQLPPPPHAPLLQQHPYQNGLAYRGDESVTSHGTYNAAPPGAGNFPSQSPSVPFTNHESGDGSSGSSLNHRTAKYSAYPYPVQDSPRDTRWSVPPALQTGINGGEVTPIASSPTYIESPSLTSAEMTPYPGRYPGDEQKVALNSVLESAPYVFPNGDRFQQNIGESVPNSRSMSPTTSTPSSSGSLPLTSSFPFAFHEQTGGQDRADFDYRRHSLPHCPEVTLHGGTADISLTGQAADGARYRVGRRPDSGVDHHNLLSVGEGGSQHDQASNDGDPGESSQHLRARRNTVPSHSRSPSPNPAPMSCTVAVIKAQAFGALRRTRARTKKTSDGAARVAMNVLEARGIDIGPSTGSKRPLDDEEIDEDTP